MLALLQNEWVLGAVIIVLVVGFIIGKWVGFKRFFRLFTGSGERVATAKAKAETAKAPAAKPAK